MRFAGKVGFSDALDKGDGVWAPAVVERTLYGDVLDSSRRPDYSSVINVGTTLSNRISVVMDTYASQNAMNVIYVEYFGKLWSVSNIELLYPRLVLSFGEEYNGPTP